MCGIAGVLVRGDGAAIDPGLIETIRDAQRHRGPDDSGLWISSDARIGLGHRRLSIVDLSPLGRQPMASEDGRFHLVFNGEIYNFRELRRELEGLGHRFRSQSDTEVLLHGYREWKLGLLDRLRGMFAFAIHDAHTDEILLARDPLGIKPCYVAEEPGRVGFASEVQALRGVFDDGGIDPEAVIAYLVWGSIGAPRTLYRGIRALPPGSYLRIRQGRVEPPTPYWRLEDELGNSEPMAPEKAASVIREALEDSVRHHLVADVPVGSFLSGGVDSSALVGLMSEVHDASIDTITLAFDVADLDESPLARQAAQAYGSRHHEIPIRIEEVQGRILDAVHALDQPSVDGVNTFFVSEAATRAGLKVAVSGVGGDELFGGYESFARIPQMRRLHDHAARLPGLRALGAAGSRATARLPGMRPAAKLARVLDLAGDYAGAYLAERGVFSGEEARSLLVPEVAECVADYDARRELASRVDLARLPEEERVSALEFLQYLQMQLLRDTDVMAMRHSLEVRTPLVDRELFRAVARVPALLRRQGPAKRWLREAPRPQVPAAIWQRRKQGFTLPFEQWLQDGALRVQPGSQGWLREDAVTSMVAGFRAGRVH